MKWNQPKENKRKFMFGNCDIKHNSSNVKSLEYLDMGIHVETVESFPLKNINSLLFDVNDLKKKTTPYRVDIASFNY